MRKPTHLSGPAAAGAATGNSSPRNWLASFYLTPSPSLPSLYLSRSHANSGIFNNCTCCAEKKKKSKQTSPKRTVGAGCGLSRVPNPRPSPVRGDDEDDNDNDNVDAAKMTRQGCRCNERTNERAYRLWQQPQRKATL